jgi:hypothetical protein
MKRCVFIMKFQIYNIQFLLSFSYTTCTLISDAKIFVWGKKKCSEIHRKIEKVKGVGKTKQMWSSQNIFSWDFHKPYVYKRTYKWLFLSVSYFYNLKDIISVGHIKNYEEFFLIWTEIVYITSLKLLQRRNKCLY